MGGKPLGHISLRAVYSGKRIAGAIGAAQQSRIEYIRMKTTLDQVQGKCRRSDARIRRLASGGLLKGHTVGRIFVLPLVLGSILLRVDPILAQSASNPNAKPSVANSATAAPQAPPPSTGIEEIVVTAQKREQLSQDVPIALTVLTASNINFRNIVDLSDLAMQVPGMQYSMDASGNQQIWHIRGDRVG